VDLPRSLLAAVLDALEADPDLRERARKVLGVEAPRTAYVTRRQAAKIGVECGFYSARSAPASSRRSASAAPRSTGWRTSRVRRVRSGSRAASTICPDVLEESHRSEKEGQGRALGQGGMPHRSS
jgi:hypothetical protein